MTQVEIAEQKAFLYHRLALVAAKHLCLFRMIRLHRLNKRIDALNRGLNAGKQA